MTVGKLLTVWAEGGAAPGLRWADAIAGALIVVSLALPFALGFWVTRRHGGR